jgi:hypothetical protein
MAAPARPVITAAALISAEIPEPARVSCASWRSIETHVTAYHRVRVGEDERDSVLCGRYLDQMEKRGGEWRITHRKLLCDWQHDLGRSVDWSQGLFGMPLTSDHAVGSTNGDQIFFGAGT